MKEYAKNIYNVSKDIAEIYFPESQDDVRKIIKLANEKEIPVYPISTGKNFGLGSHLPVVDHSVVIDLRKMNRILAYDGKLGTITIEAGVTQEQVYLFLKEQNSEFFLNVTGSAKSSSIIGNALDRGIAHYGMRFHEVLNLKGILGNGDKFSTGSLVLPESCAKASYRYALGPELSGLFVQSSFGIVTSGTYKLIPRPEFTAQVFIEDKTDSLGRFVDLLMTFRRKRLLPDNLHISNLNRRKSISVALKAKESRMGFGMATESFNEENHSDFVAMSSFCGNQRMIELNLELLEENLPSTVKPSYLRVDHTCSNGVPSDDAILSLGYGQQDLIGSDLIESYSGTLFNVLVIPAIGQHVELAITAIKRIYHDYGFKAYITLNLLEDSSFEAVVNLTFDRNNESQVAAAHECHVEAMKSMNRLGYPPIRMSIFQMKHFHGFEEAHLSMMKQLKNVLDPKQVLSKGRYI